MREIHTYYVEEGSAARKLAIPEEEWRELEVERKREERKRRRAKEQKNVRAMKKNRIHAMNLILAATVLSGFFIGYLRLQSDINSSMKHIASLETEITELKSQNQAAENRIHSTANLQAVKKSALKLGMVYATADQIVYYDMEDTDYMTQYADVP